VKAQNICVFDTEHLSPLFERVIIASGTSNRQTKSLASSVRDAVRSRGMQVLRVEGEENGEWIIVDCGAAVVHIMQPVIRDYYHLEELWGEKPVRLKTAGVATKGLVKAAPVADEEADEAPAKRAPRKTTVARSTPAKATAAKAAGARGTAAKTTAAKSSVARPAAAKKAAAPTTVERGSDKRAAKTTAKSFASGPAKKPASHTRPARGAVPTRVTASTPTRSNRATAKKAAKTAGQAAAKKAPTKKASGTKSAAKKS
jgi:ribosome-associated protein